MARVAFGRPASHRLASRCFASHLGLGSARLGQRLPGSAPRACASLRSRGHGGGTEARWCLCVCVCVSVCKVRVRASGVGVVVGAQAQRCGNLQSDGDSDTPGKTE